MLNQIAKATAGYTSGPQHTWTGYGLMAIEQRDDFTLTGVFGETGESLTVSSLSGNEDDPGDELSIYDQLRRLIDQAEKVDLFG